jgi:DNA-binding GntR family transcriptional regulator
MTSVLAIPLAPTEPIVRQITRALRQAIVTMRLQPGEMLSEQEIATRFGVSRQPVREAFIKLSEAGLIQVLPQRGSQVVKISRSAVEDAHFIREAVECAVVREASLRATRDSVAVLNDSVARQRRAAKTKDAVGFFVLDEEFHRLLAELAGRPSAWRVVEDVKAQMDRVRFIDMTDVMPVKVLVDQHVAIVGAIKAGNPRAADAAMRIHLSEIRRSLPRVAEQHADLFEAQSR